MFLALSLIIFVIAYSLTLIVGAKPKETRRQLIDIAKKLQDVARRFGVLSSSKTSNGRELSLLPEKTEEQPNAPASPSTLLTKYVINIQSKHQHETMRIIIQYACNQLIDTVRTQIEELYDADTWQGRLYIDFTDRILARGGSPTFPCVYATMGYRSDDHRYVFLESDDLSEPRNLRIIAPALREYLDISTTLGPNTSLVIIGAPSEEEKSVAEYNRSFWDMLRGLRICDPRQWPESIPQDTEDQLWTFCFNGEPVFPVMLTPAHQQRWSRNMSTPIVALQPKWVLDRLLATPEKRGAAQKKVRSLLEKYDAVDISPDLTSYGDTGTSEVRQLCLEDRNESVKCPYRNFDES